MNKKKKEEQYKLFTDAFQEVVTPVMDDVLVRLEKVEKTMATKEDIKRLEGNVEQIDVRLDRVEVKLEKIDNRLERYGNRLDSHEKDISYIKTNITLAS